MQLKKGVVGCCIIHCVVSFFILTFICHPCISKIIRYASNTDCDRYSLDAVYHEKYQPITNNIFADSKEFVSRVADLVADSLTTIMANLPDRDVSDNQEKKVHTQFQHIKNAFTSKVKKIQKNITSSWDELISSNFDLMFDNGKSSLEDYRNKTIRMADSYSVARKKLDSLLSSFIDFIKSTVRDGFSGIKMASENAIKKEEDEKKKNDTEAASSDDMDENNKSREDILREKMSEIAKMIVPGFLGNLTIQVIERNMDLTKTGVKPEDRDSVLDDIEFDMLMVQNRILAIVQTDESRDKGEVDLARRSIYTYWADMADEMYKEKLRSAKSTEKSSTGRLYYRNLWKDEEQILETLLDLMEVYP